MTSLGNGAALQVANIRVTLGERLIVDAAELKVGPGELVLLVGRNGSGKSSLVRTIAGLLPARSGQIWLRGVHLTDRQPWERVAAGLRTVPQLPLVFGSLRVSEHLALAQAVYGQGRPEAGAKGLPEVAAFFPELQGAGARLAAKLSVGERRLLQLAMFCRHPGYLWVLDEPLSGLSDAAETRVLSLLRDVRRSGVGVLAVEHRFDELFTEADRVYGLIAGRLTLLDRLDCPRPADVREALLTSAAAPTTARLEIPEPAGEAGRARRGGAR